MKKIKILFIYGNLEFGGIQRVIQLLSEELSKRGKYEIYLGLFNNIKNIPFCGEIIDIKAPTSKNFFLLFLNIIKRIKRINKIIKEKDIDVIYASSLMPNLMALLSKKIYKFKIPIIVSHHTSLEKFAKTVGGISGLIEKRYNIKFKDTADKILCVSKGVENELADNGFDKDKLITIYNPVSIDKINSMSKEKINGEHEFIFDKKFKIIISVGRFVKAKNFPLLLESYMEINKNIKSQLVIIGDGPERSKLEKLIIDNQQHDIYLLGWQENPFKYLKQSDLFVLSSNWEGFGNVIIEAMACGIPVISTDCPFGPREIIQNNVNGILVPVNDKVELSKAMSRVLSDRSFAKRLSSKGKQRSLDFSIDKITSQYEKLISEVL
ncbi:MAG: glycosyltransferase [Leptospirales bacterium]|nr:glycosyltransferase [Leptospirales bacterium]